MINTDLKSYFIIKISVISVQLIYSYNFFILNN